MTSLSTQFLRRKPVASLRDTGHDQTSGEGLRRGIGLWQLTSLGIGCTVGTGIFFVLSRKDTVAAAGPAVIWAFVIAGVVAGLTAICYAELAGAVPVSGSSYSYAYATLGEGPAMLVAGCLLLEYGVSSAAVAVGWSQYLDELLDNLFGVRMPHDLITSPTVPNDPTAGLSPGVVNLPAVVLVLLCMMLLIGGAKESAIANAVMVAIKIGVLVVFVALALTGWNTDHFAQFAPNGWGPVVGAAGGIFFSYIGLDAVSTAGEEVKDPQRNMPRAIIIALVVVTSIYLAVAVAAVGAQHWSEFKDQSAGLAAILEKVVGATWPGTLVAAGAVISIFSVTLVTLYGQTRILYSMAADGTMPPVMAKVNPRTGTPVVNTVIVSVIVALLAGFIALDALMDLTSIGTLVAFLVVSVGVIILRRREPGLHRPFKVPFYPVTPILAILGCLWVIATLPWTTWWHFLLWSGAMMLWYLVYARKHSMLERARRQATSDASLPRG